MKVNPGSLLSYCSGTIGGYVLVRRGRETYMYPRPGKRTTPPTAAQREQQTRFGALVQYLRPFREIFKFSFTDPKKFRTGHNMAFRRNYQVAITGSYPNCTVDPSCLQIAYGSLPSADDPSAGSGLPGTIGFSWYHLSGYSDCDKAVLVAHCEKRQQVIYAIGAARSAGGDILQVPAFSGLTVATYIFFTDGKKRVSDSRYTGMVNVQ
jgi:hypothetical protein